MFRLLDGTIAMIALYVIIGMFGYFNEQGNKYDESRVPYGKFKFMYLLEYQN